MQQPLFHKDDPADGEVENAPRCCRVDDCVTRTSVVFFLVWCGTAFCAIAFFAPVWAYGVESAGSPFDNPSGKLFIGLWGACDSSTCSAYGSDANIVANSQMCEAMNVSNINATSDRGKFELAFCPVNGQIVAIAVFAAFQVAWGIVAVVIAAILSCDCCGTHSQRDWVDDAATRQRLNDENCYRVFCHHIHTSVNSFTLQRHRVRLAQNAEPEDCCACSSRIAKEMLCGSKRKAKFMGIGVTSFISAITGTIGLILWMILTWIHFGASSLLPWTGPWNAMTVSGYTSYASHYQVRTFFGPMFCGLACGTLGMAAYMELFQRKLPGRSGLNQSGGALRNIDIENENQANLDHGETKQPTAYVQIQANENHQESSYCCGACRRSPHGRSVFLNVAFVLTGLIFVGGTWSSPNDDGWSEMCGDGCNNWFFIAAAAYGLNVLVCKSARFMYNINWVEDVYHYVAQVKGQPPYFKYGVSCYHWETRTITEYYTDSNGNRQSRTRTETYRVTTWTGSEHWNPGRWTDDSGELSTDLQVFQTCKIKYHKNVVFGDERSRIDYQRRRDGFYNANRYRDTHMDTWERSGICGGVKELQLCLVDNENVPAFLGLGWYFLFSVIVPMNAMYCLWLERLSVKADFRFKKTAYLN
jgi:hypothetical protein